MASTFSLQGRLGLDASAFVSGAKQAEKAIGGVADDLDELPQQGGNAGAKAGGLLSSGLAKGFAMAGGAAALAAGFKSTITAASDLSESTNAVGVAFGEAGDDVLAFGEDSAHAFGLSKTSFNEAAVGFSAFATDVAADSGDVAGVINDLVGRSTDFASVMNLDVPEAADAFRSALSGEAEPLKRFGINISDAAVNSYALEAGLIKTGEAMTDGIKVQARYGLLMQETDKFAGDFAKTSDGLANSTRIAQAQFEDLQAELGAVFLPMVNDVMGAFTDLMDLWKTFEDLPPIQLAIEVTGSENAFGMFNEVLSFGAGVPGVEQAVGKLKDTFDKFTSVQHVSAETAAEHRKEMEDSYNPLTSMTDGLWKGREAFREMAISAKNSADRIDEATSEFDAMKASLSDRSAFLTAMDSFEGLEQKGIEAFAAASTGAVDASEKLRDYEQDQIKAKEAVIKYAEEVGKIPAEVVSEINTLIDEGSFAEAERRLSSIERRRIINIAFNVPKIPTFVAAPGNAEGTDFWRGGPTWVGEKGPELLNLPRGSQIIPHDRSVAMFAQSVAAPPATRPGPATGFANGNQGMPGLVINHNGPTLSAADVSRGYTLARLAQS